MAWTRIPAFNTGSTCYRNEAGYQVYGSSDRVPDSHGNGLIAVRSFTTYDPDTAKPIPGGKFSTLKAAKAFADRHAQRKAAVTVTPTDIRIDATKGPVSRADFDAALQRARNADR